MPTVGAAGPTFRRRERCVHVAARMRIAAAVCVVVSGLFVGGAGAAVAVADPETGQSGETGGTQPDPSGGGTTMPTSGQTSLEETTTAPVSAPTPNVTAPKPTSQVGDGRNGLPSDDPGASRSAPRSSKLSVPDGGVPRQTASAVTGEPTSTVSAGLAQVTAPASSPAETTTKTTPDLVPTLDQPTDPTEKIPPPSDEPEKHQGWHWPWCWPTPPDPGQPPGSGSPPSSGGGGGGVSTAKPPIGIGIPEPPPLMQLPVPSLPRVVPPTLPVISVDPVVDGISGLATAAAQLPFTTLTLPVIVPPLGAGGAGAGGAGGPGAAPRPGSPSAPRTSGGPQSKSQPPKAGGQNPPAYSASNGSVPASYRAGYRDYLRTAGIGQVAAVAVPGVMGILLLTGAGGLVGYRQARAGRTVRANGTARFIG